MSTKLLCAAGPTSAVAARSSSLRLTMTLALTVAALAPLVAGCGSDSADEPFDDYAGIWKLSADRAKVNHFRLTCPDIPFDSDSFQMFTVLNFLPGTVSDLYETAGPGDCQFAFDVVSGMKALGIVTPDPFTGNAAQCTVDLGNSLDDATGATINTRIVITPTLWDFNLQPAVKGQAPSAQLVTRAQVDVDDVNVSVDPPELVGTSPCTFNITANMEKVSQH